MTRYYTLQSNTLRPLDLPIYCDGRAILHPTDQQAAMHYAYPLADNPPPSEPSGKHYEETGYEVADGHIARTYALVDDPPAPPRVFSKLKIVAALIERGVWPDVRAAIEGAGLYDLFVAAQDFREDNAFFARGKSTLQTLLAWSDAEVEELLAACVAEG